MANKVVRKPIIRTPVAKDWALGSPEFATPALSQTIPYENLPELIRMQVDACVKYGINGKTSVDDCGKHDTLVEYFMQQRTSDGRLVPDYIAKAMATCCRPPDARKGGRKRSKKRRAS
jgi:hypothetical protein